MALDLSVASGKTPTKDHHLDTSTSPNKDILNPVTGSAISIPRNPPIAFHPIQHLKPILPAPTKSSGPRIPSPQVSPGSSQSRLDPCNTAPQYSPGNTVFGNTCPPLSAKSRLPLRQTVRPTGIVHPTSIAGSTPVNPASQSNTITEATSCQPSSSAKFECQDSSPKMRRQIEGRKVSSEELRQLTSGKLAENSGSDQPLPNQETSSAPSSKSPKIAKIDESEAKTAASGSVAWGCSPRDNRVEPPPKAIVRPTVLKHFINGIWIEETIEPLPELPAETPSVVESRDERKRKSDKKKKKKSRRSERESETRERPSDDKNKGSQSQSSCNDPPVFSRTKSFSSGCESFSLPPEIVSSSSVLRRYSSTDQHMQKSPGSSAALPSTSRLTVDIPKTPPFADMIPSSSTGVTSSRSAASPDSVASSSSFTSSPFSPVRLPTDRPMAEWTIGDVYNFIRSIPAGAEYAEEFRSQEVDGQALMMLKEAHLTTALKMKLGPALKICSHIKKIKDR